MSRRSSGVAALELTRSSLLGAEIAQHFRIGRQEDSHEFLRFCIDNMQLSEVFGKDP